jgi:hypothetical protein
LAGKRPRSDHLEPDAVNAADIYLLEGSVRRVGETITVNAQLISTETGAHVWADRFEGERSKLGELQVEFVSRLRDADAPPHIVQAVAEACVSADPRFPLQKFHDIAVGEGLRKSILKYHAKDDEGE